jgi:hypothetical protein
MTVRQFTFAIAALALAAAPATAAPYFYFTNKGAPVVNTLGANFDPAISGGLPSDLPVGSKVSTYTNADIGFGLNLFSDGNVTVRYEFLGKEAGFRNALESTGGSLTGVLFDETSTGGDTRDSNYGAFDGLLGFRFNADGGASGNAANGGAMSGGGDMSISFKPFGLTDPTDGSNRYSTIYALFSDGGGDDFDYDDLAVRISLIETPLPPAAILFGGGLAGIAFLSRRRKCGAQA